MNALVYFSFDNDGMNELSVDVLYSLFGLERRRQSKYTIYALIYHNNIIVMSPSENSAQYYSIS